MLSVLPMGARFEPTDQEILEHLEAKMMGDGTRLHPLINVFIPTLEVDSEIWYTHPETLPGNLSSINFKFLACNSYMLYVYVRIISLKEMVPNHKFISKFNRNLAILDRLSLHWTQIQIICLSM